MHVQRLVENTWLLDVLDERMYSVEHVAKYGFFDSQSVATSWASTASGFYVDSIEEETYVVPDELTGFGIRCDTILSDLENGIRVPFVEKNGELHRVSRDDVVEIVDI